MKMTATGAPAPQYATVQAEMAGMILDNGTPTASNTITASAAIGAGSSLKDGDLIEITSEANALGVVPAMAGKFLLVPRSAGSAYFQFIDPSSTAAPVAHAATIPGYVSTTQQFVGAVRMPSGKILLIPFTNPNLVEYDPWANTFRTILAHGRAFSNAVPAFSGAAVGADDIVYLSPGYAADKAICTYDERTEQLTVAPATLPFGSDWQTANNGGPVVPLPDGDIMFLTARAAVLAAPWRYRPASSANAPKLAFTSGSTTATLVSGSLNGTTLQALFATGYLTPGTTATVAGTVVTLSAAALATGTVAVASVTNAVITGSASTGTSTTSAIMYGAQVSKDGKYVVLCENIVSKVRFYRLADNYVLDIIALSPITTSNPWSAIVPLGDGKLGFIGNGNGSNMIVDPASFSYTAAQGDYSGQSGFVSGGSNNTVAAKVRSDGSVLVLPGYALASAFIWTPYAAATVPVGVRASRYVDRK